ncbi:MAG: chloramphenicol acetyltransferase [Bacteroidaceae bacterium]|nr:chloramphenicol acetyltransferase [Bacteroidaceae bacterium]
MKQEINPQDSIRANAFDLWMSSPMPMVTLMKTFDVSRIVKISKHTGLKFNMLLCWCIGKAACGIKEFYLLPEKPQTSKSLSTNGMQQTQELQGKLYQFDKLAINVIVENSKGDINSCDIPYSDDLQQFNSDYLRLTAQAANECQSSFLVDYMIIGTSTLVQTELDCIVNQYSGIFNNPFLAWAKYRKGLFKTTLPVSFQFHHVQMDGGQAAHFLDELQKTINTVKASSTT